MKSKKECANNPVETCRWRWGFSLTMLQQVLRKVTEVLSGIVKKQLLEEST